jgi:hypothetical protein
MDKSFRNLLKLFLLFCIFVLAGLVVCFWFITPNMTVLPTDITIASDLQARLRPLLQSSNPVKVIVGNGVVRLEGTINSQYEHDAILEVAKQGAGTNKIQDELKIKPSPLRTQGGTH